MTRNSILVAAIVVVLGLGGGLWLALTPGGDPAPAQQVAPGVAAPQPTPAARPGSGGSEEPQTGETEPAQSQPAPSQSQSEAADSTQPEEELAEEPAERQQDQGMTEAVETPADGEGAATALAGAAEDGAPAEAEAVEVAVAQEETAGEETQASLPTPEPPSFDIVRVEKDGSTVVAGRAPPGSTVTLYDGDTPLASGQADSSGSFVLILEAPLPPGSRVLTLSASRDGATVASLGEVVVVVPEREGAPQAAAALDGASESSSGITETEVDTAAADTMATDAPTADAAASDELAAAAPSAPIVIATNEQGASVVLQAPGDLGGDTLRIEAVDYDLNGQVVISGRGPAGGTVALYLDQALLGQTTVGADGRWRFTPETPVEAGLHRLRADLLTADGKVAQRAEIPFSRAEPIQTAANGDFVVVQPGNSLWVIARGKYGQGIRYTAIYEANAGQIRDPDLIYPGQIFLIPQVN